MGIGHLALGFAAKRAVPRLPLWVLLLAPMFVDVLWGVFILVGLEHARITPGHTAASPLDLYDFPYTHSLPGALAWSLLFGLVALALFKHRAGAVLLGALVFSHFLLDVVAHSPDMPVLPGGPFIGLGLWNSVWGSILVEEAMLAGGLFLYLRATRARAPGLAVWGPWAFAGLLVCICLGTYLGPPPPGVTPVALLASVGMLLLLFPYAFDRRRETAAA